jgi:hypothetical protein
MSGSKRVAVVVLFGLGLVAGAVHAQSAAPPPPTAGGASVGGASAGGALTAILGTWADTPTCGPGGMRVTFGPKSVDWVFMTVRADLRWIEHTLRYDVTYAAAPEGLAIRVDRVLEPQGTGAAVTYVERDMEGGPRGSVYVVRQEGDMLRWLYIILPPDRRRSLEGESQYRPLHRCG